MIARKDQALHDDMIRQLISHLSYNDFTEIRADVDDMVRPERLWWPGKRVGEHVPDAVASKDGRTYIFEVETADTLTLDHAMDQWCLFADHARRENAVFIPVIPTGQIPQVQKLLKELELEVEDIWDLSQDGLVND